MASSFSAFGIVWSIVFVLFFLIPGILRWIRQRREIQNQRQRAAARSRQLSEQWDDFRWVMPLGNRLMAAQERQHRRTSSSSSPQTATELCRRRKEFIRETLVLKKVVLQDHHHHDHAGVDDSKNIKQLQKGDLVIYSSPRTPPQTDSELSEIASTGSDSNFSQDNSNDDTPRIIPPPSDDDLISEASDDDRPTCTICFNPYEPGEEICWSNNPQCNHMFHGGCIEEWLIRHDECPCCRLNYMMLPKEVEVCAADGEEEEEVEGIPSSGRSLHRSSSSSRKRRQRVPPLSNEQSSALAEGNGDATFSSAEEQSFASMLATIEQLYRQAQVRLYYEGTTTGINNNDPVGGGGTGGGPRIIALPMPQHPVFRQRPNDSSSTSRRSSSQANVSSLVDVEMGMSPSVLEEETAERTTPPPPQEDGIVPEASTAENDENRMSA